MVEGELGLGYCVSIEEGLVSLQFYKVYLANQNRKEEGSSAEV